MKLTFRIGAQAGAGVMVTGRMLGRCFTRGGYNVLGYPEYPSLVRGGHNVFQIRIGDNGISSPITKCDVLLALNKDAVFYHKDAVVEEGIIVYDEKIDISEFKISGKIKKVALPIEKLLKDAGAIPRMANAVQIGAALAAINYPIEIFEGVLKDEFGRKGEEIVNKNIAAAKAGYDFVKSNAKPVRDVKPISKKRKMLVGGNEALALGAVKAGLKFYAAYPMTPASSILHYLCAHDRDLGIVVKQTEDEISAINEAIGANFAGVRSATGTSGGGFALMTESMGLAGLSETPLVVYLVQRVGPSTGMPTWTEQADLRFALHSGQGEFLRVILAPGDINEAFELSAEAFNLSEKYQIPSIVTSDKFLSESMFSVSGFSEVKIERGKIKNKLPALPPNTRFKRYEITKDGVSPRVLPGTPNGLHVATSYEHDETGFSSESFSMRKAQVDKRAKKEEYLLKEIPPPKIYGDENAEITIVAWGPMKLPALEAMHRFKQEKIPANMVHFTYLYPLDEKKVKSILGKSKHTLMIENNSTGQFAGMLKEYCGWEPDFLMLKYTGRPFYAEEIYNEIMKLRKAKFKGNKEIRILDKEDLEYYNPQRYGL